MLLVTVLSVLVVLPTIVHAIKCNGLKDLCDLKINQVTFPGSHNAGSGFDGKLYFWAGTAASSCFYRNHGKSYSEQLNAGLRYFDIDTCFKNTHAMNCHCNAGTNCAYAGSIHKGLLEVDKWMKSNPNEVIIIHFNRDVQNCCRRKIAKSLEASLKNLWSPNNETRLAMSNYYRDNKKWPTLKEAVESNQRIFLFMHSNLAKHLSKYDWLLRSNDYIASTWGANLVGPFCSGITTNAKSKCGTTREFVELAAFSYWPCIWEMAKLCSKWLGEAQEACYRERQPLGKTVNFLAVDWSDYYSGGESVVNKAKFMNQKNIKEYLRRDIFFPELQGCSFHAGRFDDYCWKYCPKYGRCWINQSCFNNTIICKQKSFSCYSSC